MQTARRGSCRTSPPRCSMGRGRRRHRPRLPRSGRCGLLPTRLPWPQRAAGRGSAARKKEESMPCLFAMFAGMFPRAGTLLIWIARPEMFSNAFGGSWVWPLLRLIFLPFSTLMYVLLWSSGRGVQGFDWFWLVLAVFLDLTHWAASATQTYENRESIPGYQKSGGQPASGV